jgi:hypothetical protein
MTGELEDNPRFWAVVEHHRLWMAHDGCFRQMVQREGKLTEDLARVIVQTYGVQRTMSKKRGSNDKTKQSLLLLISGINEVCWPDTLPCRANICIALAKEYGKCVEGNRPISAVTKLMWFRRPTGWTMFDGYARQGLIGSKNDAMDFYKRLDQNHFPERAARLTELCRHKDLNELWGERIIDKFLMLHGAREREGDGEGSFYRRARWLNEHYLKLLPEDLSRRLRAAANDVSKELCSDTFPVWQKRRRK